MDIPNLEQLDQTQSSSSALTRNQIANHDQDTDNDVEEIVLPHEKPPKRRRKIIYVFFKEYPDKKSALVALNEDFLQDCSWAKLSKNKADDLTVQFYYCSSAGRFVCPVRLKIVQDPSSMKVSIYISEDDHSHPEPKTGISTETKEILRQLYFYEKVTHPDDFERGFAWEILGLKVVKQKFGGKTFFFVQRTPMATQASTSTQATTSTQASTSTQATTSTQASTSTQATTSTQASTSTQATTSKQTEKRKRGRPPKKNVKEVENKLHEVDTFKSIIKER
ncbi:hypothetical protein BpHYR1_005439, partial [Brachionus plicatilis]